MSSFICDNEHISALAYFTVNNDLVWNDMRNGQIKAITEHTPEEVEKVARILYTANLKAIITRYGTDHRTLVSENPFFVTRERVYDTMEIIKACSCYNYQACDDPEYNNEEAHDLIQSIIARAVTMLPGWDEADAWDIGPRQAEKKPLRNFF